ncbi:MAG TPA: MFS transporter [Kofleriaceae bacterium]|nr:MFS transporter [Kofleriaceae bacterium]
MEQHRKVDPWVWMVLNLPFGATSGFVSVMIGFLLKKQGMGDDVIASLVALNLLPHTWKVMWAPIADSTLTRKRWYMIGNLASCATILGIAFTPIAKSNIGVLEWLVFLNSLFITFVGMSVEGLMAHATPPEERGKAAGWFQAGNLGGAGIGGGLGLTIAEHVNSQVAFIVIAVALGACTLALTLVPEAPRLLEEGAAAAKTFIEKLMLLLRKLWEVLKELGRMIGSRRGIVGLTLCFLPIGSAAASGIFSGETAKVWGASADLVATTTGFAAGIAGAVGCFVGGIMSDKIGRRMAYAAAGVIMALVAVVMAVAPQDPLNYAVWSLAYQFGAGIAYGTFTAFVLEVIGKGAAATKYNLLASLSNIPITYMTKVDGWASVKYGPVKMLFVDAGSEIAGIVVFVLVLLVVRPDKEKLPESEKVPEKAPLPEARIINQSTDR